MKKVEILQTTNTGQQVVGWFALQDGKIIMHVTHPPDGAGVMHQIYHHAAIYGNEKYDSQVDPAKWLATMVKAYQGSAIRAHPVDDAIAIKPREVLIREGGAGSGDIGHAGRPGIRGGSAAGAIAVKARKPRAPRAYKMGREDPIEQKLAKMQIVPGSKHVLGGGISQTFTVQLKDGTTAVWKPDSGAGEESHQKEVGAWEVAQIVGNSDMAAPTVTRTIGRNIGSLQLMEPGTTAYNLDYDTDKLNHDQIERAAIFDYVIANGDRHDGNWMVDGNNIHLIDHNLAFAYGQSSHLVDIAQNYESSHTTVSSFAAMAKPYIDNRDEIMSTLKQVGLDDRRVRQVGERIDELKGFKSWSDL